MKFFNLLKIRLNLFDGAAGGATAGATSEAGSTQGETQATPVSTRRGKTGEYANVVFGKQAKADTDQGTGTEAQGAETTPENTLEARRKAYRDMVNGEYKDLYTEDTQRKINRRFSETKNLEAQVGKTQPIIDMLMQRYNISDGDTDKLSAAISADDALWAEAAEDAGLSVEQYREMQRLKRENETLHREERRRLGQEQYEKQLADWYAEAETLKGTYPDFDLEKEVQNDAFMKLLSAHVPMEHAFKVIHMDEIMSDVAATQARTTEKQVLDNVRARGTRPQENGTASQSAFTVKDDVHKLTKKDRAEAVRRAAMGENIVFG